MQDAETVLNVIRERGERGLPLENIYRLLYNRNLYLRAYGRLYSNQGAMTKGTTAETVDGMSLAKIDRIIDALRYERFRWTPVRRVNIPKPNGKTRPLGIPTWTDKLLQEVIRMILEAYYEPQFSDRSHGFRPDRGCHSALSNVTTHWTGVRWFVEGDIKGCFDNIDHEVMLSVLGEKLHDNRFLRLLKYLLKAGYMEDWKYGRTLSGTPQGGVVSPVLANVYLDRLGTLIQEGERHEPRTVHRHVQGGHRPAGGGVLPPLYRPSENGQKLPRLLRKPLGAQADAIRGAALSLEAHRGTTVVGEMGTGKTFIAAAAAHLAGFKRVLVLCPPHLVPKWKREVEMTVPGSLFLPICLSEKLPSCPA